MQNHYAVVQAGLIPFAAGSLAYFYRRARWFNFSPGRLSLLISLWILNEVLALVSPFNAFVSGLYITVAINVFLVPMIFNRDDERGEPRLVKLLGRIAYPVFVCHIPVGALVYIYLGPWHSRGLAYLLVTLIVTVLVSCAISLYIEGPIERYRSWIRAGIKQKFLRPKVGHPV